MGIYKSLKVKKVIAVAGTSMMLMGALFTEGVITTAYATDLEATIKQTDREIGQLLEKVSKEQEKVTTLNEAIEEQEGKIQTTQEDIQLKEEELDKRIEHVTGQLQAMQVSELNQNIVITLLNAESLTEVLSTMHKVKVINEANEKNITETQEESDTLEKMKKELVEEKEEFDANKEEVTKNKQALETNLAQLKKTQEENKEKQQAKIRQAEEARKKEIAKEEANNKQVKTASSSVQSAPSTNTIQENTTQATNTGGWMTFQSTAYSTNQPGLSTHTAMGVDLRQNPRVIAVDPRVIPLGSLVEVEGMGVYLAADTGGAIKGRIIDMHFTDVSKLRPWGRRNVRIRIVN